jgi:hypothetical protein
MKKILLALFLLSFVGNLKAQQTCSDIPVINNFSPTVGFIGSIVTINGANFDPVNIQNNVVYFGATKAEVVSATFGKLEVVVPVGASTAPISVTNDCKLTAYSQVAFNGIFCPTPITNTTYATNSFELSVNNGAYNLASADFNNDRKPEIISGGFGGISIAVNNSTPGNLSFTAIDLNQGSYAGNVVPADVDGDGLLDLVTPSQIFRNTSSGQTVSFDTPYAPDYVANYQVYVADINNDGKLDIIGSDGDLRVALNTSTGPGNISFAPAQTVINGFGYCTGARAADIDADGLIDFFGSQGGPSQGASARNITVPGSTTVAFETPEYWSSDDASIGGGGDYPYRLVMADFDGDEKIDFASPNFNNATSVAMWRNNSTVGNIDFSNTKNFCKPAI